MKDGSKKKKKFGWKLWVGIIAGILLISAIGNAMGGNSNQNAASPTNTSSPAAEASATPSSPPASTPQATVENNQSDAAATSSSAKEESQQASSESVSSTTGDAWAQEMYQFWLTSMGIKSPLEILKANPESAQAFVNGVESPSAGTLVFTVQLTEKDIDKEELERSAMAMLNIIGYENKDVERVEIVTADSLKRGVANRYNSPMLNR